jgi:hypothetical protein
MWRYGREPKLEAGIEMNTLYSMQRSGNSYKVRLALAQLHIPRRLVKVDILWGERASRAFCRNRAPALVILRPRRLRSNRDTPRASSSARTRRLTAVCRTPSSLAAPLKLRWSATLNAQPIDIGLTAADSVIPLGDDLLRGMVDALLNAQCPTDLPKGRGPEGLEPSCSFQNRAGSIFYTRTRDAVNSRLVGIDS